MGTPAIEQLRQYANIDSQREQALSNLIPHVQTPLPFQAVMAAVSCNIFQRFYLITITGLSLISCCVVFKLLEVNQRSLLL